MYRDHTEGSLSEPLLSLDNDGRTSSSSSQYHRRQTSGMGFTWKHILYLVVMMMFGAALLDAIINGGLAALMYHDQGYIRMWEWPTTLGADIIITTLLTGLLTWIIASNLVMRDLRVGVPLLGKMGSLGIYSPEFREGKFYNYFLRMEDCIRLPGKGNWKKHFLKFFCVVLRGIPFTIICFIIFGPATLGVMMGLEYGAGIDLWWPAATVFKAIWGGALGFLITPVVGILAMASFDDNEPKPIDSDTTEDSETAIKSETNSLYGAEEEELPTS